MTVTEFIMPEQVAFKKSNYFPKEIICDALTQTGWKNFLSKILSCPKFSQDVSTKNRCSPPPNPQIENLGLEKVLKV